MFSINKKRIYFLGIILMMLYFLMNINGAVSISDINTKFQIYGYYPSWKSKEFPISKIPKAYFDGIFHAFIWPDKTGKLIVPSLYTSKSFVRALKEKGKLVSISVGGGNNSDGFENIAINPDIRNKFISDLKNFIEEYGYNGIDLDWEYPRGTEQSKSFIMLANEIRKDIPDIILTTALPLALGANNIEDINSIQKSFDYIFVMAYDIENGSDGYAGHNAPLFKNNKMPKDVSISTLLKREYIDKGVPKEKLILGIPLYGKKFNVDKPYEKTNSSEDIEYKNLPFDSCKKIQNGGAILLCDNFYISYDSTRSIGEKISFAKAIGLGGISFWALGQDNNRILNQIGIKK